MFTSLSSGDVISVTGDVSGTWAVDTVLVRGEIQIPPGETLNVEPGVEVFFMGYYKFVVGQDAALIAIGSESDSILFTPMDSLSGWHGIRFLNASSVSSLSFCIITHGKASGGSAEDRKGGGIYCSRTDLTITNCRISACEAYNSTPYNTAEGGGVYASESDMTIEKCVFENCETWAYGPMALCSGAGIAVNNSNLNVSECQFRTNESNINYDEGGASAISANSYSNLFVDNCSFRENTGDCLFVIEEGGFSFLVNNCISDNYGGGLIILGSSLIYSRNISFNNIWGGCSIYDPVDITISNNMFCDNTYTPGVDIHDAGTVVIINNVFRGIDRRAIFSAENDAVIEGNVIYQNTVGPLYLYDGGAGIRIYSANPIVNRNVIIQNSVSMFGSGGGIFYENESSPNICNNVICGNLAYLGGAIGSTDLSSISNIINSIIWENSTPQIYMAYGSTVQVKYSNISGNWPGIGNIDEDPLFVNPELNDYRLQWDSPCIDTGDPDPQYNDPDGTRADMGAFYFDQSKPVRALITPHEIGYLIPIGGGDVDFTITATSINSIGQVVTVWCDLMLPDSSYSGTVFGPETMMIDPGESAQITGSHHLVAEDPMGVYFCNIYGVAGSDTSKDSFMFGKTSTTGSGVVSVPSNPTISKVPTEYQLMQNYPNPFNPVTVIGFTLPDASLVRLEIYDVTGRLIESPLHGWRDAGVHEVTLDGTHLASGIYVYKLTAGNYTASGKMVLLK
jgi:hypothetical protein